MPLLLGLYAAASRPATLDAERLSQALGERLEMRLFYRLAAGTGEEALRGPLSLWVRPRDLRAQRNLCAVGISDVALDTWMPTALEAPALADLLSATGALDVRAAPRHMPLGRHSLRAVDGAAVHAGDTNTMGYRGRGVLIGLIDTGIDPYHPAFIDDQNFTRVVAIWDQDRKLVHRREGAVARPEGFDYGASCDVASLRERRCDITDPIGHGTHVAGIAAGHAHLVGGLAPHAALAVVRSQGFERIADATLFLTRLAQARNEPLVINISVGGHYGPHDGTSPLEQYLERHSAKGRVIVAAAGNEGDRPLHVTLHRSDAAPALGFNAGTSEGADAGTALGAVRLALMRAPVMPLHQPHPDATALLELWGQKLFAERVAIELWHRGRCVLHKPLALGGDTQPLALGPIVLTRVRARRERAPSWGNDTRRSRRFSGLSVAVEPVDDLLEELGLRLVVAVGLADAPARGNDPEHAEGQAIEGWLSAVDGTTAPLIFAPPAGPGRGWQVGDTRSTLSIPATGRAVLSVASATVQRHWHDETGLMRGVPHELLGGLSTFSSLGPVPWGGPDKPELTAPGSVVVSARGAAVPDGPDTLGPLTMVMQGTSMAAPHVAGTVALMMEAAGALDVREVRRILTQTARPAPSAQPGTENGWGAGMLNARAAVRAAETAGGGCAQVPPAAPILPLCVMAWRRLKGARQRSLCRFRPLFRALDT